MTLNKTYYPENWPDLRKAVNKAVKAGDFVKLDEAFFRERPDAEMWTDVRMPPKRKAFQVWERIDREDSYTRPMVSVYYEHGGKGLRNWVPALAVEEIANAVRKAIVSSLPLVFPFGRWEELGQPEPTLYGVRDWVVDGEKSVHGDEMVVAFTPVINWDDQRAWEGRIWIDEHRWMKRDGLWIYSFTDTTTSVDW